MKIFNVLTADKGLANALAVLTAMAATLLTDPLLIAVRDVALGEDAHQAYLGAAPQILATFRNLAMNVIRLAGSNEIKSVSSGLTHYCGRAAVGASAHQLSAAPGRQGVEGCPVEAHAGASLPVKWHAAACGLAATANHDRAR